MKPKSGNKTIDRHWNTLQAQCRATIQNHCLQKVNAWFETQCKHLHQWKLVG